MKNDAVFLVAFEGIDNCGKTTLVDDICRCWSSPQITFCPMKELTSEIGTVIKSGLYENRFSPVSKVLLFAADRQLRCLRDHVQTPSHPVVYLADRWVSSAIAYRCAEDPSLRDYVLQVNSVFAKPVLTILLDIPAEESIARGLNINKNNYSVEFLARVRAKYLEMAEEFSFKVIDAKQPYEVLRQQVMDLLRQRLIEWGYSLDLSPRNLGRGG